MAAYYIGVAHAAQVAVAAANGFVAFSHGREAAARRLSAGDKVLYYAPKSDFNGIAVQSFIAHATVTGDIAHQRDFMGGDHHAWARDAVFDAVTPVPVRPLIDRLGFIADKARWGMAFRKGQVRILPEDYGLIAESLLRDPA